MVHLSYTAYDKVFKTKSSLEQNRYLLFFLIWEFVHVAKYLQRSFLSFESRHITGQVSKSPKMSEPPQNSDVAENEKRRFAVNSQAPDVPELAHQGIFQLSRLSVSCNVKTIKIHLLHLNLTDFMKILSVSKYHCESHNNFMKFFWKIILFLIRLAFNDTKTHFYKSEVVQR